MAAPTFDSARTELISAAYPGPVLVSNAITDSPETNPPFDPLRQDAGTLPSHFNCVTCTNAMFIDNYKPEQASLSTGDVYGTKDSIYAVVVEVMNAVGQPVTSPGSIRTRSAMQSRVNSGLKFEFDRPCVLLRPDSFNAPSTMVCLMATYGKSQDLQGLPPIFSHFSVPVHPNPTCLHPFYDHVHSTPEWHRFDQWIFAFQFKSDRVQKHKRWKANPIHGKRYYAFGKGAMAHVLFRCQHNLMTWLERCAADPEWAAEQRKLIVEHEEVDNLSRRQSFGSTKSGKSYRTYQGPQNAARSLMEATIPEDEVAAMDGFRRNENIPLSGPSHRTDTPGGAYRTKGSSESRRTSRTSLTSMENAFSTVRVDTPIQTDTKSVRSAAPYRKGRKGSGGRRFLNNIMDRVLPSRRNSKE